MIVKPFAAVRPTASVADQVAALPYDVYDRVEAVAAVDGEPLSFLNIDRPETQFSADVDMYAPEVYAKARELFDARRANGTFVTEPAPCFYLYELTMGGARRRASWHAARLTTISKTLSRSMRTRSRRRSSTGFAISMPSMRKRAPFSLRIAIPMQSIFWLRR